ncbi:hypothetical protein QBC40DRAFT_250048 [Triangularia verruculosa]|uniref:Uncharacterized protein n=1 Tax=Triangularia verruculosa TaxID=2587418 RepID=A0AAN6XPP1_9PEZI|nr:hypothetical protein QBC40DRAFT_250048 [Triangularia verruculosa]
MEAGYLEQTIAGWSSADPAVKKIHDFVKLWCGCNPPSNQQFGEQCHNCNRFKAEAVGSGNGLAYQYTWSKSTQTFEWVPYKLQWLRDTERAHLHEAGGKQWLNNSETAYDASYQNALDKAQEDPSPPRVLLVPGFSWSFFPSYAARVAIKGTSDGAPVPLAPAPITATAPGDSSNLGPGPSAAETNAAINALKARHTAYNKLCCCEIPGETCRRQHVPCELVECGQGEIEYCRVCRSQPVWCIILSTFDGFESLPLE